MSSYFPGDFFPLGRSCEVRKLENDIQAGMRLALGVGLGPSPVGLKKQVFASKNVGCCVL